MFHDTESRIFVLLPGWDACSLQGYPLAFNLFASIYLYTWVDRGLVRVTTISLARAQAKITQSGDERTNQRPPLHPQFAPHVYFKWGLSFSDLTCCGFFFPLYVHCISWVESSCWSLTKGNWEFYTQHKDEPKGCLATYVSWCSNRNGMLIHLVFWQLLPNMCYSILLHKIPWTRELHKKVFLSSFFYFSRRTLTV